MSRSEQQHRHCSFTEAADLNFNFNLNGEISAAPTTASHQGGLSLLTLSSCRNSQMFEEEELDLGSPAPASPPAGSDCQQAPPQTEEVVGSVGEFQTVSRLAAPTAPPAAPSAAPPAGPPAVPPAAPSAAPPAPRKKRVLPAWMLAAVAGSAPSGLKGVRERSPGVLLGFHSEILLVTQNFSVFS